MTKFIPKSLIDSKGAELYKEYYKANKELFIRDPVLYWKNAREYVSSNIQAKLKGREIELTTHSKEDSVISSELAQFLAAHPSKEAIKLKKLEYLGNFLLLNKAENNSFMDGVAEINEHQLNYEPTPFDNKEFRGDIVIKAFTKHADYINEETKTKVADAAARWSSLSSEQKDQFARDINYWHRVIDSVRSTARYKLKANEMYPYSQVRMYASEAGIMMEDIDEALLAATVSSEVALPHFVLSKERLAAAYVAFQEGWLVGRTAIAHPFMFFEELTKMIPPEHITNVDHYQVDAHAWWLARAVNYVHKKIEKAKKVGRFVPEVQKTLEQMIQSHPELLPQKA